MALVRLTDHVLEGNNVKTTIRKNRGQIIPWVAGTVVEMSEASAKKYIDAKKAEALTPEEEESEREKMAEDSEERRAKLEQKRLAETSGAKQPEAT